MRYNDYMLRVFLQYFSAFIARLLATAFCFMDCPSIHSFICLDKFCYRDISRMAWTIL